MKIFSVLRSQYQQSNSRIPGGLPTLAAAYLGIVNVGSYGMFFYDKVDF